MKYRKIDVELTILVPKNYKVNPPIEELLDDMENMNSGVSFLEGMVIGESNTED